jgi:hypothetical protein
MVVTELQKVALLSAYAVITTYYLLCLHAAWLQPSLRRFRLLRPRWRGGTAASPWGSWPKPHSPFYYPCMASPRYSLYGGDLAHLRCWSSLGLCFLFHGSWTWRVGHDARSNGTPSVV